MEKVIDYYFSVASPWAYLGLKRFRELAQEHQTEIKPYPITIVAENGAIASKDRPQPRRAYWQKDLLRWAWRLGKRLRLDNRPTSDWIPASYMVIAADLDGLDWLKLTAELQRCFWEDCLDIGDAATRAAIADTIGMDGSALLSREQDHDVQAKWNDNLLKAREAGIFGSPTFVFENELYWGQDSLPFLDMHLSGKLDPSEVALPAG